MLWLHIARRYIFSPKSHSVINIISLLSVIAVAIPTAAMVILLAIFNGLSCTIDDIYSAVDADIEIVAQRGQTFAQDALSRESILECEGVEVVAPYVEQSVMLSSSEHRTTVRLRGVDSCYLDVLPLEEYMVRGTMHSVASGGIVLGSVAASNILAYGVGSEVELYALNRKQVSTILPISGVSRARANVGGVAVTNAEIDATLALYDLRRAQKLLNYRDKLSGFAVKISQDADIKAVERTLQGVVGDMFEVRTRDEKNASMNAIISMERYAILIIGALIALVASFSIVGAVVMLITDKRRDIVTLRAMGASKKIVRNIFVGEGLLLTLLGTLIGAVLGVIISLGQQHYGWVKIYESSVLESFPVDLRFTDTLIVALIYILLGWLISRLTVDATLKKQSKI